MHNKVLLTFLLLLTSSIAAMAATDQPEMADLMRSNGKIYVVVMVIATIFVGIIAFLIRLDRKVSKIEKNN
jgi:hypothetical protein